MALTDDYIQNRFDIVAREVAIATGHADEAWRPGAELVEVLRGEEGMVLRAYYAQLQAWAKVSGTPSAKVEAEKLAVIGNNLKRLMKKGTT